MPKEKQKFNLYKIALWLFFVIVVLALYFTHRELFNIDYLQGLVGEYKVLAMILYIALLSVLGFFFIPSTPFVVAGLAIFSPMETYLLNLVGIVTSSIAVYYFARFLGLDEEFERRYPQKIKKTKKALSYKELPIIIGWSMVPVVPTDLILYVASGLRVPLWKCLVGVGIGEGTANIFYIFAVWSILA
jgi:uncharacterized membrane protein YdjX (TVP38/TMEM64 family)